MNSNIVKLVTILQANGFNTCDSGDGKTHEFSCDRPYPYVSIKVSNPENSIKEAHRLVSLLMDKGIRVLSMTEAFGSEEIPTKACIQLSYDPIEMLGIIDLMGISDSDLQ